MMLRPPRSVPNTFRGNFGFLYGQTLGKLWADLNSLRLDPPISLPERRPATRS